MTPDLLFQYGMTCIILFCVAVYVLSFFGFFDE